MRNHLLRFLLPRSHNPRFHLRISQVNHLRSFTSSIHPRSPQVAHKPFLFFRHFTSSHELAVEHLKPTSDPAVLLADVFAEPGKSNEEIKLDLYLKNVVISHELILSVLSNPDTIPDIARRVFDWVLECHSEKLSSKSYNLMLGILGDNGFVKESWDMIEVMKKKGYGVSKGTFYRISKRFEKDGFNEDVEKLKELYASGSAGNGNNDASKENALGRVCSTITKIIRSEVWGDSVEKRLQELREEFSSDLVKMVLKNLETDPNKALIFFRWVQESSFFKHDQQSFNAIARVLAKEDYSQKFWSVVDEMRSEGHEMEMETYVNLMDQFVKRKMIKDAVDLYGFAMGGDNKPSAQDCTFLLKKIVVSEEIDMDLFLKVVRAFKANGNVLTNAHLDAVLKSLTSVGRMTECNRILEAMKEGGYVPSGSSQQKVAFTLSSSGKLGEAQEFMDRMKASGDVFDNKAWVSVVEGCCKVRNLDEASNSFRNMVENEGASCAGYALDLLIGTYCRKNRPFDAYKFVSKMVNGEGLRPWHTTYKTLTSKLLVRKQFKEALDVMNLMKSQGYPPDLDSFAEYLSRTGNAEDATAFLRSISSKRLPSTSVFLRLFEAYLKAGRQSEAQDLLSKCPRYVRNHADVLNLFYSSKSGDITSAARVPV